MDSELAVTNSNGVHSSDKSGYLGYQMTIGVTIVQGAISALLWLAPRAVLKQDRLRGTSVLAFFAIFGSCQLAGLLLAVPLTLLLVLHFLWVRYVGYANQGPKRVLFFVTIVLSSLYLMAQCLHLPVRLILNQSLILIWANIVGIAAAGCLLSAPIELYVIRKLAQSSSPVEIDAEVDLAGDAMWEKEDDVESTRGVQ